MNKAILHDHLDGGLRPSTALELAHQINYAPLLEADDVSSFFDRSDSSSLDHYLEAFTHTIALMQTEDNLERIAYEAAEDMHNNGINIYESRYAPFYSVNETLSPTKVLDSIIFFLANLAKPGFLLLLIAFAITLLYRLTSFPQTAQTLM